MDTRRPVILAGSHACLACRAPKHPPNAANFVLPSGLHGAPGCGDCSRQEPAAVASAGTRHHEAALDGEQGHGRMWVVHTRTCVPASSACTYQRARLILLACLTPPQCAWHSCGACTHAAPHHLMSHGPWRLNMQSVVHVVASLWPSAFSCCLSSLAKRCRDGKHQLRPLLWTSMPCDLLWLQCLEGLRLLLPLLPPSAPCSPI